jgi:hypothetical protein
MSGSRSVSFDSRLAGVAQAHELAEGKTHMSDGVTKAQGWVEAANLRVTPRLIC